MQNDLISRSVLRQEVLDKMSQGGARGVFLAFIDEQPIAYNVENVVEQLKENSKIYCEEYHQREGSLYIQDAVEIVRNGGKE